MDLCDPLAGRRVMRVNVEDTGMLVLVLVPVVLVGVPVAVDEVGRTQDRPILQDRLGRA